MLSRIASLATRLPRATLLVALAVALLGGLFGASVATRLEGGGFVPDQAESSRAARLMAQHFNGAEPNIILLVSSPQGVDTPAAQDAADRTEQLLHSRPDVTGIGSYWTSPPAQRGALRSADGTQALIVAYVSGSEDAVGKAAGEIATALPAETAGVTVRAGGPAAIYYDGNVQAAKDLTRAETIALPLTLIVLILVFGSVVAAALPLVVGIFAILVTMALLRLCTMVTDVSVFALNMTTAMGLALAIDYSLFIVSRYREELAAGQTPVAAAIHATRTAGHTVLFSALTVGLALSALAAFDMYFLRSFAYAGLAVVATAAVAAIVILPAALVLLGPRVNALDLRKLLRRLVCRGRGAPTSLAHTFWYRVVVVAMRHAIVVAVVIIALLLLIGAPFLGVKFGFPDDRVLPTSTQSRAVGDVLRRDFPMLNSGSQTTIVLDGYHGDATDYATTLSRVAGVGAVTTANAVYAAGAPVAPGTPQMANDTGQFITVLTSVDPYSPEGTQQLHALREVPPPAPTLFGGAAAVNTDALGLLGARLPVALGSIVVTTLLVLFAFTGSLVLPVKAVILNTLSLTAMFGAMVWIYQDGHLHELLNFSPMGYLVPTMPILMFCVAFGMSMDYEVFVLSRVREAWLASPRTVTDNTRSVAIGVARTGGIVTAAALLMAIVFGAMITAKVTFMQMFGLGLTLTVLADATVVRGLLVPALMRLLGRANWWAPAWLRFGRRGAIPAP